MEFLPHTKDKEYADNIKSGRFLQAVSTFKSRRSLFELAQTMRVMIFGQGNLIGEEDAMKDTSNTSSPNTLYTTSVSCISQTGEAYYIRSIDFRKFIMQTDMDTWHMLEKNALKKELHIMRVMEGKFKLEEEAQLMKEDYPNKYLDVELSYMKEIREAYFMPKEEEL